MKNRSFPEKKISAKDCLSLSFSLVSTPLICQSILLLINELRSRGYPIYDFDNKNKSVQGIKIIRNRIYFLAAEEEADGKEHINAE